MDEGDLIALCVDKIAEHEGFSSIVYKCTGDKLTIGHGRNVEDFGITKEEAKYLLSNDVHRCIREAKSINAFNELSVYRKYVIVDMLMNLGLPRLLSFKRMLKALEERKYDRAADEMLNSLWASQVGKRATFLAKVMREDTL